MTKPLLSAIHFHNEEAAFAFVEARLWPNGPICPHCGNVDPKKIGLLKGSATRIGLRKCYACRKQFTVKMGSVMEASHFPLRFWLQTIYLMCSSKKGISIRQIQRTFQCSMKTAWFLTHRIREAMIDLKIQDGSAGPLGGANKVVEADETYVGGKAKNRKNHIPPKEIVVSLVERGGKVRSRRVPDVTGETLKIAMVNQIDKATYLMTDEAQVYGAIGATFAGRHREPQRRGICPCLLLAHQHHRGLLLDPEARDHRRLSSRQPGTPASVSWRVRFPIQRTDCVGR
jgi:transposase-like protein